MLEVKLEMGRSHIMTAFECQLLKCLDFIF